MPWFAFFALIRETTEFGKNVKKRQIMEMVPNTKCYFPDKLNIWLKGIVVQQNNSSITVKNEQNNEQCEISLSDKNVLQQLKALGGKDDQVSLPLQNEKDVEDLITLGYLHEPAILYNIKSRFDMELPYTYTGEICIAVNPYQWLPELYTEEKHLQYLHHKRDELAPHVYAISIAAYQHMSKSSQNQSILVSGESGKIMCRLFVCLIFS